MVVVSEEASELLPERPSEVSVCLGVVSQQADLSTEASAAVPPGPGTPAGAAAQQPHWLH